MRVYLSLAILLLVCIHFACQKEVISADSSAKLLFSQDTIRFDTVFTEAGSATRSFRAINPLEESILISSIQLANVSDNFRLNIDGLPMNEANEIVIAPKDSIWIFVEVTIDPDMPLSLSPFVIEGQVFFLTNGNEQSVILEAWGQNANYFPNRESAGEFSRISCDMDSLFLSDPKPYVFYGIVIVDSCFMVMPPGTRVHVHGGVAKTDEDQIFNDGLILFTDHASLSTQGTADDPVIIEGDRLEDVFADVSGQWSGIRFLAGSKGNRINHTEIKNSIVGVRVDSAAFLRIENSKILNTAGSGIIGVHSSIVGKNCLFADNAGTAALFTYGGTYTFFHSTFANYTTQSAALHIDNFSCIDGDCDLGINTNRLTATFTNCIFTGSDDDELELVDGFDGEQPSQFRYQMANCIVKVDELLDADQYPNFFDNCENCISTTREDSLFIDYEESDYHLDTMSIAISKGLGLPTVLYDIEGNARDANMPDVGCYEFID